MSWSLNFCRVYYPVMTLNSVLRYRRAVIRERQEPMPFDTRIRLQLRKGLGQQIVMRPSSNDGYTLKEVFVDEVYAPVEKHVVNARRIMDLGANIGLASIYFLSKWPHAQICCVEPDSGNINLLEANLSISIESGKCQVIRGAAWSRTECVCITPLEKGHVNQRACVGRTTADETGETVQAYSMNDLVSRSGFSFVDLLKMDIEGAEAEVFSGDTSWLDNVGVIAVEFHGASREKGNFDRAIKKHGFDVVEEGHHTVIAKARTAP